MVTGADVRRLLPPGIAIDVVRAAMAAVSAGTTAQLPRAVLPIGHDDKFGIMAASLADRGYFGAKLVGVVADPERPGRQAHRGLVALFGAGGQPLCVADAEEITLARTAAASAVATDVLARGNARTLGMFGTGAQAEAHVRALVHVRPIERVRIWGRSHDRAEALAVELRTALDLDVRAEVSPEATAAADILCTVTTSVSPILFADWVAPGTHVNLVGSSRPGPIEIDLPLLLAGRYIVDSRVNAVMEAAEFLAARDAGLLDETHIAAEIGEVLLGRVPGRRSDGEITLYKSLGHPVQDLAAAAFLYEAMAAC